MFRLLKNRIRGWKRMSREELNARRISDLMDGFSENDSTLLSLTMGEISVANPTLDQAVGLIQGCMPYPIYCRFGMRSSDLRAVYEVYKNGDREVHYLLLREYLPSGGGTDIQLQIEGSRGN